jgi:hypothetical protein
MRDARDANRKQQGELEVARSQLSQLESLPAEIQRVTTQLPASIEAKAELEHGLQEAKQAQCQQQRELKSVCTRNSEG